MITVSNHTGRFCEGLFVPPFTVDEANGLGVGLRKILAGLGKPAVFCSDMRQVTVFPPAIADLITGMMKGDNPRIERSAILIRDSSVFGLQIERMIRDAGTLARRAFRARPQLEKWLAEVLDPAEKARMKKFLDEHEQAAG